MHFSLCLLMFLVSNLQAKRSQNLQKYLSGFARFVTFFFDLFLLFESVLLNVFFTYFFFFFRLFLTGRTGKSSGPFKQSSSKKSSFMKSSNYKVRDTTLTYLPFLLKIVKNKGGKLGCHCIYPLKIFQIWIRKGMASWWGAS